MTINIAGFLDASKYDVVFYVIGKDWGSIRNSISAHWPCHLIKVKSYKDFLTFRLIKVISKEKPRFVFSSLMPINSRLLVASSLFPKVKAIIRSNNYLYTQSWLQKARLFLTYRFLDHLIVQTDEMRDEHLKVLRLAEDKVVTLANPVNIDAIKKKLVGSTSPFEGNYINYVYVGRVTHVKGLDILVQSFAKLLADEPGSRLYIVGQTDGIFTEFYNKLKVLIRELDIEDKIIFTGFSDNPYQYMKYADCMVLPSRNEGLPNVVIESLYLHTPVAVTASIPVIRRIVRNGVDGYVVEVDDVDGLATAMKSASKLGRVQSSYSSASKEDFQHLFAV